MSRSQDCAKWRNWSVGTRLVHNASGGQRRHAVHRSFVALLISLIALLALMTNDGEGNEPTSDADAIRQLLQAQAEAWNQGDLERFMQDYWKSEQLTFSSGGKISRGWQATLDGYRTRYPDRAAMGRVTFDELEFSSLGPDAHLVLGRWQLQRDSGRIGGRFTLVFRRLDGQWKIVHDHTSQDPSLTDASSGPTSKPEAGVLSRPVPAEKGRLAGVIELNRIDDQAIHYATFQSHNQKVVAHGEQIWMSHIRTRNEPYTAQQWRLSRSRDGGRTFVTHFEATHPTNPPVLEVDQEGNVYLIRVDFVTNDAYLERWLASESDLQNEPHSTTRIPGGAAGKYAAQIDLARQRIYLFSHNNTFHRLKLDGTLIDSRTLLAPGPHAILQYPLLSLNEQGQLHLAWTTQKHGEYLYWDIHHLLSDDGGETFRNWTGQSLELPIVADDTGPATRVTADDEFSAHTWLSSSLARGAFWHGLYLAQLHPPRQHYVRYDVASGQRSIDRQPVFAGESIELQGLDGFFISDQSDAKRLYVVGNDRGRLSCLVSDDEGSTWHDYARCEQSLALYSIGGFRWTMDDGSIVGSFTDQRPPQEITDRNSSVYFFRIRPAAQ